MSARTPQEAQNEREARARRPKMSARSPQEAQDERQRAQEAPRASQEQSSREILLVFPMFLWTVFCLDVLGFSWAHAMLEAIPPQSGRARARSARARAHPRLSNIAGARLGFLLLLLRCCLEMFETFSS